MNADYVAAYGPSTEELVDGVHRVSGLSSQEAKAAVWVGECVTAENMEKDNKDLRLRREEADRVHQEALKVRHKAELQLVRDILARLALERGI